jgi:hypothetical protein
MSAMIQPRNRLPGSNLLSCFCHALGEFIAKHIRETQLGFDALDAREPDFGVVSAEFVLLTDQQPEPSVRTI